MPFALVVYVPFAAVPLIALILLGRWWPSAAIADQRHSGLLESLLAASGALLWAGAILVAVLWIGEVYRAVDGLDVVFIVSLVPRKPGSAMLAASCSAVLGVVIAALMLVSPRIRRTISTATWYPRAVLAPVRVLLASTVALMFLWGLFTVLD
jgi:hypothetical protein